MHVSSVFTKPCRLVLKRLPLKYTVYVIEQHTATLSTFRTVIVLNVDSEILLRTVINA